MVRFWDTSALVPLVVAEHATKRSERWLREDPEVLVWTLTRAELLSALARRRREEPGAAPRLLECPQTQTLACASGRGPDLYYDHNDLSFDGRDP